MDPVRTNGPEDSGISGNVVHIILYDVYFKLGLSYIIYHTSIDMYLYFCFLFYMEREERNSFSPSLNERKQLMWLWLFCPQHHSLLLFLPHIILSGAELVAPSLCENKRRGCPAPYSPSQLRLRLSIRICKVLGRRDHIASQFIFSINIWANTVCQALLLTLGIQQDLCSHRVCFLVGRHTRKQR